MSLISNQASLLACEMIPTIEVMVGKKMRSQYDIQEIIRLVKGWTNDYHISRACFERLRPMPKQASQTGFSLGAGSMLFKTIFTFLNIPFMEIEPRTWQKDIFGELGIQYNKDTTKQASVQAARLLFPGFDFRPTERCTKDSDGLTDSALIASHCLKINNK